MHLQQKCLILVDTVKLNFLFCPHGSFYHRFCHQDILAEKYLFDSVDEAKY
jgi:hypothetical protein